MLIFSALVYLSMKAPLTVLRTAPVSPEGAQARIWAMTLLAAFAGISVGVFFLSFNYHQVLWVFPRTVGRALELLPKCLPRRRTEAHLARTGWAPGSGPGADGSGFWGVHHREVGERGITGLPARGPGSPNPAVRRMLGP